MMAKTRDNAVVLNVNWMRKT